jgi:hypothetical protein
MQKITFTDKDTTRKNASRPLKIHIESSSDDSDFVHPPLKRNRGPQHEPCNIAWQPPRPTVTQSDKEAATKKVDKVMLPLLIVHNKKGCLYTIF